MDVRKLPTLESSGMKGTLVRVAALTGGNVAGVLSTNAASMFLLSVQSWHNTAPESTLHLFTTVSIMDSSNNSHS